MQFSKTLPAHKRRKFRKPTGRPFSVWEFTTPDGEKFQAIGKTKSEARSVAIHNRGKAIPKGTIGRKLGDLPPLDQKTELKPLYAGLARRAGE